MATADDLRAYFDLADQLIAGASKEDLAEAARLLALNVAHYHRATRGQGGGGTLVWRPHRR